MKTSLLLPLLLLFVTLSTSGQPTGTADELLPGEGTEFRFGFLQNEEQTSVCALLDTVKGNHLVSLSSRFPTIAEIYFRGEALRTVLIHPGGTVPVELEGDEFSCVGETVCDNTFRIVADHPIRVQAASYHPSTMEASQVPPMREWGRDHVAITLPLDYYTTDPVHDPGGCADEPRQGEIGIVAGEDSTVVVIIPTVDTRGGMIAGKRYERVLMAGEMWQIQDGGTERGMTDLTGTAFTANRPVGVFTGHVRTGLPYERQTKNHLFEALPALRNEATAYHAGPLYGVGSVDVLRIINPFGAIAVVSIWSPGTDGPVLITDTLESVGSWFDYEINGPVTIESTRPIQIAQFTQSLNPGSDDLGDPSMVILTPLFESRTSATFRSIPFRSPRIGASDTSVHYGSIFVDTRSVKHLVLGDTFLLDSPWLLDYQDMPAGPDEHTSYTWLHFVIDPQSEKVDLRGADDRLRCRCRIRRRLRDDRFLAAHGRTLRGERRDR